MFFNYIWQSSGLSHKEAYDRFSSVLSAQCDLYEKTFGQKPILKVKQLQDVLIGQVRYDTGIIGWEPWVEKGGSGIVWNGVCEDWLGKKLDTEEITYIIKILRSNPKEMAAWNGMFSVSAWNENENKIYLATAATSCPTLWHTEGPYGWASGSRTAPLLEMVGRKAAPDSAALGLYLSYGYFIGGHSPFEHVYRIRDRQLITIEPKGKRLFSTYLSLGDYMEPGNVNSNWKKTVSLGAERLLQRVNIQLRHSPNPVVLLTGGRDSRSIAAAAKKSGCNFITATSGAAGSEDVIIAARVAKLLDVKHRLDGEGAPPQLLCNSIGQLKVWTLMSEGLLPLKYCLHLKDFLASNLSFSAERFQVLHGLEPGIGRGSFYPNYPNVQVAKLASMSLGEAHSILIKSGKNRFLKPNGKADDLLRDICLRLDAALHETGGKMHHWFELLLWRERGLVWGMDLQSVYSPTRWAWMPLFDRELMKLSWNLTMQQKIEAQLLLDISATIESALAGIQCTQYGGVKRKRLVGRIRQRMVNEWSYLTGKRGVSSSHQDGDQPWRDFWSILLFSQKKHLWREFIDDKDLTKIVGLYPQNDALWRLSTIDLMAELF